MGSSGQKTKGALAPISQAYKIQLCAEVPTLATKEAPEVPEVLVKFGELELVEVDTEQDPDYSPSEADTEDSLEYSSETERLVSKVAILEIF